MPPGRLSGAHLGLFAASGHFLPRASFFKPQQHQAHLIPSHCIHDGGWSFVWLFLSRPSVHTHLWNVLQMPVSRGVHCFDQPALQVFLGVSLKACLLSPQQCVHSGQRGHPTLWKSPTTIGASHRGLTAY